MKRIYIALATTCLILSFLLWGCGDGPGPPGSEGTEDTGIIVRILGVSHSDPNEDSGDVWTIDIVQQLCGEDEYETFGDDFANITFSGDPLYAGNNNILYITNYKVTFDQLDPSSPPIDEIQAGIQGSYQIVSGMGSGPYSFLILDVGRKLKVVEDITYGPYVPSSTPLLYNMTIEMWGEDTYGNDFKVGPIIRVILLANYDHC